MGCQPVVAAAVEPAAVVADSSWQARWVWNKVVRQGLSTASPLERVPWECYAVLEPGLHLPPLWRAKDDVLHHGSLQL